MKSSLRNNLVRLHSWSGLTVGLVMVFLAVTGAGFVLRPQLDRLVNRDLLVIPQCAADQRLALDDLAASARKVHPASKVDQFLISADAETSLAIQFLDKDLVYFDPCTGAYLGTQNEYGGFFGTMDYLHRFRFLENSGKQIAGWCTAIYILLLLAVGVLLWWPRSWRLIGSAAKFNPRLPGSARTLNLHKIVGLYSSIILLAVTLMSLPIAFKTVNDQLYRATGSKPFAPGPRSTVTNGAKILPAESFRRSALALMPDQRWALLRLPRKPDDAVYLEILEGSAPHELAKSYLYFDAYTGETKLERHYGADTPRGRKLYLWMIELHSAAWGGMAYQGVLFLVALGMAVQGYSGFSPYLRRKFRRPAQSRLTLKVIAKTPLATGICAFELADPKGRALPPFSAGSHLDVYLEGGLIRQYSLCNNPADTHRYQIGVLRLEEGRGGSRLLHDMVEEGDLISVGMPRNHFPLAHAASRSLLLAGGIGITPILCMAERLANIGADFTLHYCVRSVDRAAFIDRIRRSAFADRVLLHVEDGPQEQRFQIAATLAGEGTETHLYVCGPTGFMSAVLAEARAQGWPDQQVHREYFAGAARSSAADQAFEVKIARTGKCVAVPKGKTVVAALAEAGIDIQTSCGTGVCGTCLTRVLEGVPDHRDLFQTAEERARNDQFTPCCSRAQGAMLVLDI